MDDDLGFADRCVGKLACFRVKELKDVLTQLQLSKQGKKQDLVDRIISLLYDEEMPDIRLPNKTISAKKAIANVIDDVYRKMEKTEVSGLATIDEGGIDIGGGMPKEEAADIFISDGPVRCPCGSPVTTEFMIKCVDHGCQVQQHFSCVIVLENPTDSLPPKFYCEVCRIKRADPFWDPLVQLLHPVKLNIADTPTDGSTNQLQFVEKTFQLTRSDRDYLQETYCDVQAWCILLNDSVPFRMQWPQYASLEVNGMAVRTVNRPGSQLLGANGRDDGASIKLHIKEGVNKISLSACDPRVFCFGLRLVRRRAFQEVLNMIPKEADGEHFEDALARIHRCMGGGVTTANEDSDSDIEVIAESITVNIRCPLSGSRIKIASRFKPCVHMGCFDLETFVGLSQRSRKWQCPICLKNYSMEDIIIDPYFNRITTLMQHCGEDITEIDLKPDGSWSARTNGESSDLAQWHLPDGSISAREVISNSEFSNPVGQASHAVTVSNGASGSCGDVEDPSTNQGCSGQIDMSISNGNEIDSILSHFDPSSGISSRNLLPSGNTDIIFLSDSEDEDVSMVCPNPICPTAPINDNDMDLTLDSGPSSSLDVLNGTENTAALSVHHTNTDYMDEGLIDNSLPFVGDDRNLKRFLQTQSATVAVQSDLQCVERNAGARSDYTDILNVANQYESNEDMNSGGGPTRTTPNKVSYSPFSFPRQPRSARRAYLFVDSD